MGVFINSPIAGYPVDGETKLAEPGFYPHIILKEKVSQLGTVSCPLHVLPYVILADPLPFSSSLWVRRQAPND